MILKKEKEKVAVEVENNKFNLTSIWYRYNKIIIIVGIVFIFGMVSLLIVNKNNDNPDVDNSAYIGIETIMVMNAKKYVTNNKLEINEIGKYLSLNYLNLIVKEEYDCNSDSGVQIKKVNKEIIYTPYLVCDEYQSTAIKEVINDNEKVKELELVGSNPYFITKSYNELGYNIDDKYTVNIVGINDIEPGVNLIKYNVLKSGDYYKTVNRIVIAESIRGSYPELVLEGKETMTIPKGSTYVEPGYKAIDKIDGTITDKVVVNNNIDTNKVGTYSINYSITNNKKLTTTINRTIIVNDSDLKLDITNNVQTIDKKANIVLTITGKGYSKTILPNKEMSTLPNVTYTVYKNGTYTFIIYDTNNNSETYDVKISTLDQTPPQGACTGKTEKNVTTVSVDAKDESGIKSYLYRSENQASEKTTATSYTYRKKTTDVVVDVTDKYDNTASITCEIEVVKTKADKIVDMAIWYFDNMQGKMKYAQPDSVGLRVDGYNGVTHNGYIYSDCNSFVGIIVKKAINIGPDVGTDRGNITIAGPSNGYWIVRSYHKGNFHVVKNKLSLDDAYAIAKPGDLLASNGDGCTHIQIYIGDNCVIGVGPKKACGNSIPHARGKFTVIRVNE